MKSGRQSRVWTGGRLLTKPAYRSGNAEKTGICSALSDCEMDRPAAPWTATTVRGGRWITVDTCVDFATVKLHTDKGTQLLAMAGGRVARS